MGDNISQDMSDDNNNKNKKKKGIEMNAREGSQTQASPDLPFLVTQWLSNYKDDDDDDDGGTSQQYARLDASVQSLKATSPDSHTINTAYQSLKEGEEGPYNDDEHSRNMSDKAKASSKVQCTTASGDMARRRDAVRRIRAAAAEISSAFSDLGAFGSALESPFGGSKSLLRNATYADLSRRSLASTRQSTNRFRVNEQDKKSTMLEAIVQASAAATQASFQTASETLHSNPLSIIDAAYEVATTTNTKSNIHSNTPTNVNPENNEVTVMEGTSYMRPPALLRAPNQYGTNAPQPFLSVPTNTSRLLEETTSQSIPPQQQNQTLPQHQPGEQLVKTALASDYTQTNILSARSSRRYLSLKDKVAKEKKEMESIQRSILYQKRLLATATCALPTSTNKDEDIESSIKSDATRVIAQLTRKLTELLGKHDKTLSDLSCAKMLSQAYLSQLQTIQTKFTDPISLLTSKSQLRIPTTLSHIALRQYKSRAEASSHSCHSAKNILTPQRHPLSYPRIPTKQNAKKSIIFKRLSHSVTVNCHLIYPVYCLRFDRTGRYFITGADDHLVKVFCFARACDIFRNRRSGGVIGKSEFATATATSSFDDTDLNQNMGGAILVCTLRGHAGVVTDIDVSADNSLLATASEDGDVRVWGFDGCPVAILRGHEDGANMVSWSTLTPYRLVTTGQDGLARMWDVREAALKRCGRTIGSRTDYTLKIDGSTRHGNGLKDGKDSSSEIVEDKGEESNTEEEVSLPPLPMPSRQGARNSAAVLATRNAGVSSEVDAVSNRNEEAADAESTNVQASRNLYVPPLPPGAEQGVGAIPIRAGGGTNSLGRSAANGANGGIPAPGAFVANDSIDEGVRVLAKLQHGDIVPGEQLHGPGTRARRKAVKVICITRCPIGGHFATGSDDGLGRVWIDEDDYQMDDLDKSLRENNSCYDGKSFTNLRKFISSSKYGSKLRSKSETYRRENGNDIEPSKSTLIATLHGHLNSVTDIQYSYAGDRILTASQRDGVVRIWMWGSDSCKVKGSIVFDQIRQIMIRLTNPLSVDKETSSGCKSGSARRRGGSTSMGPQTPLGPLCDLATWSSDDTKIITSQTCLLKQTGAEIVPGSHVINIWDSRTGRCLVALPSAHSAACQVLISHPHDSSILASASTDGSLKVWDLDTGKCMLSHTNTVQHGPVDPPTDRGKVSGYLDGNFCPNGLNLVLTDDSGRITIFDVLRSEDNVREIGTDNTTEIVDLTDASSLYSDGYQKITAPEWMKQQYFANDYYDLFYDSNGYCIERGSEQPPHLAPQGARCDHTGAPYPDQIQDAFFKICGPGPLSELEVRIERDDLRRRSHLVRLRGVLTNNVLGQKFITVAQCAGPSYEGYNNALFSEPNQAHHQTESAVTLRNTTNNIVSDNTMGNYASRLTSGPTGRALSANYRWRDYDDVLREEQNEDEGDSDDEEYEEGPRLVESDFSSENEMKDDEDEEDSSRRRRNFKRRNQSRERPRSAARSRRRNRRGRARQETADFEEITRNQPSRISARQMKNNTRRQRYRDGDSSDEFDEYLSKVKAPQEKFKSDYTKLGHFFKMPMGHSPNRMWVRRTECILGSSGMKTYAPQVGDSVVYIPKAHYDTLNIFPTRANLPTPWQKWPRNSSWPVVRCTVKDIRYRFPYEHYYIPSRRNGSSQDRVQSIVAILTLEVTGIPKTSDDSFPWPRPEFISRQTRSSTSSFEVSIFESGQVDFVIPENVYIWRVKAIENAICKRNNNPAGLELVTYFTPVDGDQNFEVEDADFIPHNCKITFIKDVEPTNDHLHNSGYNALTVQWTRENDESYFSPWEVTLEEYKHCIPSPLCLSNEQKGTLIEILDKLEENPYVRSEFSVPVDTKKFVDYEMMIEVPMDLSFIRKRIDSDYYTNVLSVDADMRLLRDNCIQYNGSDADISVEACELYEKFHFSFKESMGKKSEIPCCRPQNSTPVESRRRSSRLTDVHTTSLESLPGPSVSNGSHNIRGSSQTSEHRDQHFASSRATTQNDLDKVFNAISGRDVQELSDDNNDSVLQEDETSMRQAKEDIQATTRRQSKRGTGTRKNYKDEESNTDEFSSSEKNINEYESDEDSHLHTKIEEIAKGRNSINSSEEESHKSNSSESEHYDSDEKESSTRIRINAKTIQNMNKKITRTSRSNTRAGRMKREIPDDSANSEENVDKCDLSETSSPKKNVGIKSNNTILNNRGSPVRRSTRNRKRTLSDDSSSASENSPERPFPVSRRRILAKEDDTVCSANGSLRASRVAARRKMDKNDSCEEASFTENDYNSVDENSSCSGNGIRRPVRASTRRQMNNNDDCEEAPYSENGYDSVDENNARSASEVISKKPPISRGSRSSRRIKGSRTKYDESSNEESEYCEDDFPQKKRVRYNDKVTKNTSRIPSDIESITSLDSDSEGSESSENFVQPTRRGGRKRSKAVKNGRKRRGRAKAKKYQSDQESKSGNMYFPNLARWPNRIVEPSKLRTLSKAIISKLEKRDTQKLFRIPVVEEYPQFADSYLRRIPNPMDFRSIRSERIPAYREISELQEDLILIFKNCCNFNGEKHQYWRYAVDIWSDLNTIFKETLQEEGINVPRRL